MKFSFKRNTKKFAEVVSKRNPGAYADILGDREHQSIVGRVDFYQVRNGVLLVAEIHGLPTKPDICASKVFGFHIHEGEECSGDKEDPFRNVGMHYNPDRCTHPQHAGDLPPLFENNGYAFMTFYTNRFRLFEVIGRTIIVHQLPDDFTTSPSGSAGAKIACGEIKRYIPRK
ncbi:MAG: superoxide dismutase family protein [Clostridiaceae bacterium]|jgi:Cu-Zn family superoxide dismutase|nr:superoxide dismutase family protein [Clostridiaceae bacterium]